MNISLRSFFNNRFLLLLSCWLGCCACRSGSQAPFIKAGFDTYGPGLGKRITEYHDSKLAGPGKTSKGVPAMYIDFSAGINNAFKDSAISGLMAECFNTVLAEKFQVFKMATNQVTPLAVNNTAELGQKVSNAKEYLDIWAPIQATVEKITRENNDALLITDFEEWQNKTEITNTAYLKIPFSRWLAKGNTIHFFIADYKEGAVAKHIYFTIFNCGHPDASNLISKLAAKLGPLSTRFDLSSSAYQLTTEYPGEQTGGIFFDKNGKTDKQKNILDLRAGYINGLKNGSHYEFYPFGIDWPTIAKTHDEFKAQNQFNDIFRNLFIDLSNDDSYLFEKFAVTTADISGDFDRFSKSVELAAHRPKLSKGNNGESKFADDEKDAIALGCYNADGTVKEEYKYKPQSPVAIPEMFLLNEELFKNTRAGNNKKIELGISFDPKFQLKNIADPNGLLKIDITVKSAVPNTGNPKLEKFKWINAKGVLNIGLYESVKNTLQELQPDNKVIYTYYIKTNQL